MKYLFITLLLSVSIANAKTIKELSKEAREVSVTYTDYISDGQVICIKKFIINNFVKDINKDAINKSIPNCMFRVEISEIKW